VLARVGIGLLALAAVLMADLALGGRDAAARQDYSSYDPVAAVLRDLEGPSRSPQPTMLYVALAGFVVLLVITTMQVRLSRATSPPH
jgi:hypothetical protein